MNGLVYKLCRRAEWRLAEQNGTFGGNADDVRDGLIHLSSASQVRETARRHFAAEADLVLVGVDAGRLGAALMWEPSRAGALFPHLYGPLPMEAVVAVHDLPRRADGELDFPEGIA